MAEVKVRIGGRDFPDWNDIRIYRTLQHLSGEFELKVWGAWQATGLPRRGLAGQPVQIRIDNRLVFTGYIDAPPVNYDATNHLLTLKGRDRTADLVDCSVLSEDMKGNQWVNQSLISLAQRLCPIYKVGLVNEVGDLPPLQNFRANYGSTAFEFLDALARIAGVLLTSDAAGNLVITRAGHRRATTPLILGKNILSASGGTDLHNAFSHYYFREQESLDLTDDAQAKLTKNFLSTDNRFARLKRYRPLLLNTPAILDPEILQRRLDWERNIRYGRSEAVTYKVQGWQQDDGTLWEPNTLVHVVDPYAGFDGDRLITDVTYLQSSSPQSGGTRCEITVMPAGAFSTIPHPEEDIASGP